MFVKENVNPVDNITGDCVVRATAKYLDKSWDEVYLALCKLGMEMHSMPNSPEVYKAYYELEGLTYISCSKNLKGKKRPKVLGLAKKVQGILRVANHLTVAKEGRFFDTWDCGDSSVYGYWTKETGLDKLLG